MKPLPDDVLRSARLTTTSFNIKTIATNSFSITTIATIACIVVVLFIALYAMTVNPNDSAAIIGFPP
jgi:ABC-type spermidine/putrescine transport system permease subunit I